MALIRICSTIRRILFFAVLSIRRSDIPLFAPSSCSIHRYVEHRTDSHRFGQYSFPIVSALLEWDLEILIILFSLQCFRSWPRIDGQCWTSPKPSIEVNCYDGSEVEIYSLFSFNRRSWNGTITQVQRKEEGLLLTIDFIPKATTTCYEEL